MSHRYASLLPLFLLAPVILLLLFGCDKSSEVSASRAVEHAKMLVSATRSDVDEIKKGMPSGAEQIVSSWDSSHPARDDLPRVRELLDLARVKVQDLRVAKSTFFAWVDLDGTVLRTDREPDVMAGHNFLSSFPDVRACLEGRTVQARGSMPEASAVRGRPDGQWVYAVPLKIESKVRAIYATGWSWSAYAYRLENALRSDIRSHLGDNDKEPLIYVYVVVENSVFGAPISPTVNADAIKKLSVLTKLGKSDSYKTVLEITGRSFGLGVVSAPSLGKDVAVAVLRSET